MQPRKSRWSKVYESSEEELIDLLSHRGIAADRITAEAFDEQTVAPINEPRTLWCAEGSLMLETTSTKFSLQPGDTLTLPAGTGYTAIAGISGYAYYSA